MKEFIEKLIERLDELRKIERDREDYRDNHDYYEDWEEAFEDGESNGKHYAYAKAIEIIKQFEKEYVPDINVGNSSENLTSWISCDERLPEKYIPVLVMLNNKQMCVFTLETDFEDDLKVYWSDWYDYPKKISETIAWMPLPEPFKGE